MKALCGNENLWNSPVFLLFFFVHPQKVNIYNTVNPTVSASLHMAKVLIWPWTKPFEKAPPVNIPQLLRRGTNFGFFCCSWINNFAQ